VFARSTPLALPALCAVAVCGIGALPASASGPAQAAAASRPPSVETMIVGTGGKILAGARSVAAAATTLHVGGRGCAVAPATPLAVLAAERRAGGPSFRLRDYGHCGPSPANSGELFVYSIGGETNSGQSGWEYKVDGVSGSTGAGDESGPMGNGRRLRSGDRVLWFWCEAVAGGCQRTLSVSPASATASPGGPLAVTVTAEDNEGRAIPVGGAIVTLGGASAATAADGQATLAAPSAPGSYQLQATRAGLVPSFPGTVLVG